LVGRKEDQPFGCGTNTKAKRPQQQARIELLESEDDASGNETAASANINGANGTDNESSDDERD
jgi:hypothetical protein